MSKFDPSKPTPNAVKLARRALAHKKHDNTTHRLGGDVSIIDHFFKGSRQTPPNSKLPAETSDSEPAQTEQAPFPIMRRLWLNVKEIHAVPGEPDLLDVQGTFARFDAQACDKDARKIINNHLMGIENPLLRIRTSKSRLSADYAMANTMPLAFDELTPAPFGHNGQSISRSGKTLFLCEPQIIKPDYALPKKNDFALRMADTLLENGAPEYSDFVLYAYEIKPHPSQPGYTIIGGEMWDWDAPYAKNQDGEEVYFAEIITGMPIDLIEKGETYFFERVVFSRDVLFQDLDASEFVDPRARDQIDGTPEHAALQKLRQEQEATAQAAAKQAAPTQEEIETARRWDVTVQATGQSSNRAAALAAAAGANKEEPIDPAKAIHPDLTHIGSVQHVMIMPFANHTDFKMRSGFTYVHGEATNLGTPGCKNGSSEMQTKTTLTTFSEFPQVRFVTLAPLNSDDGTEFKELDFYRYRGEFIGVDPNTISNPEPFIRQMIHVIDTINAAKDDLTATPS